MCSVSSLNHGISQPHPRYVGKGETSEDEIVCLCGDRCCNCCRSIRQPQHCRDGSVGWNSVHKHTCDDCIHFKPLIRSNKLLCSLSTLFDTPMFYVD